MKQQPPFDQWFQSVLRPVLENNEQSETSVDTFRSACQMAWLASLECAVAKAKGGASPWIPEQELPPIDSETGPYSGDAFRPSPTSQGATILPNACPSCEGRGTIAIDSLSAFAASAKATCPVCSGSGLRKEDCVR